MYKKRIRPCCSTGEIDKVVNVNPFCDDVRIARPVSYFVKGGIDLDGVSNRPPIPGTSSDADAISDGVVDIATDPTLSRLDIMDYASVAASESEARAAENVADV